MSLEQAPDEVKLAVDLIMLLENHDIAPQTVLAALEIVRDDYLRKLRDAGQSRPSPQAAEKG
ncbi:pleiotropic regulatory protein RsmS [Cronobacter dublinensis]|uniref:pleiotropic regulatory protein RsmS n=1 Tax=Cronobacter dublinensis TaxID=413497 RepID=UPI000CFB07E1|nr:pleiotropic regulatory protein RsmS [Cronobacter dublinensis]ELQ5995561.1 pleiotropic regulatory protein RsmS [Cronobacter dublinensis]ELZ8932944.1 pleiotropic regulatory protein RsmS [Cronobacter dublinensis]